MSESPRCLHLIDGSGYIFRAFHALPPMTRPDGTPVNAVYGFTTMIMKLLADTGADHLAVVFDTDRRSFRTDIYPDYKAHRPPPPEDLVPQFPLFREAARAFGLPVLEERGFEADDLIATLTRRARAAGWAVVILSSDKDLAQLVAPGVTLVDPIRNTPLDAEAVREKYGVGPDRLADLLALAGDASDNVPGVPGIGPKIAAQLLSQHGDLETLLAQADSIPQPKRRQTLLDNAEQARLSYRLVTLAEDAPVALDLDDMAVRAPDPAVLRPFLETQNFRSLLARFESEWAAQGDPPAAALGVRETDYTLVQDADTLAAWVAEAREAGVVAVDTETDSLNAARARLVGVSLCVTPGRACYIPVGHTAPGADTLDLDGSHAAPTQLSWETVQAALGPLLADTAVLKVGHNIKYDMIVLARHGCPVHPVDDTMLLSYVLEGGAHGHGLDELSRLHLGHETIPFKAVAGSGRQQVTFDRVPLDKARDYAAEDADITLRLFQLFKPRLVPTRVVTVYESLDRPLVPVLAAMEQAGVCVDADRLRALSQEFAVGMAALATTIHELAGDAFNIASPKQLGDILFERLGLSGGKKGKTGAYGTGADVLEALAAEGHALPARVLEWRQLAKLKSTYTDALVQDIHPETGRVHTAFAQAVTTTGRLSSSDPNLQNIPIRTPEGRRIREAFVAPPGQVLLSADYSQIELRLVAHVAGCGALIDAFHQGADIHATTAAQVFGVPEEGLDPALRRRAKAINFGIIYGISAFGLARQLGIAQGEAKRYIDAYFERFPEIRTYMDETKAFCHAHGYVRTPFGRRCHVPGIKDRTPARRSFAERAAINAPIQGGAADIIKRAMVRLPEALTDAGLAARMLLQVHDELILEVPEAEADATTEVVRAVMSGAASLTVPLVVDAGIGPTWAAAH